MGPPKVLARHVKLAGSVAPANVRLASEMGGSLLAPARPAGRHSAFRLAGQPATECHLRFATLRPRWAWPGLPAQLAPEPENNGGRANRVCRPDLGA